jgi:DNA (cytosine-5)-methyltransferase 1
MKASKADLLAVDMFCGAGGASTGLVRACDALGVKLWLLAINHWPQAVQTHLLNHPGVEHKCEAIERINPRDAVPGGRLNLLLAGPECTHHSNAAGGRPKNEQSRASAWHIAKWAQELYIDTILIENVPEFRNWGPLGADQRPLKSRKGETFKAFLTVLESLGYKVEVKILNAADYGDPTTRQRLFVIARRGNSPVISWPSPTHSRHGQSTLFGPTKKWKAAREIIDWSLTGRSIFHRKTPLKPATIQRIITGLEKFGGPELKPFLVILRNNADGKSLEQPVPTVAAEGNHIGLAEPFLMPALLGQQGGATLRPVSKPAPTVAASGAIALVEPVLVAMEHGGRELSVDKPMPTITTARGGAIGVAEPFLSTYYGHAGAVPVSQPVPTITAKDRVALVQPVINGRALDIRFRMLQPHELAAAMSFPKSYQFTGKREDVVRQIGNSWPGELSYALNYTIAAQYQPKQAKRQKRIA